MSTVSYEALEYAAYEADLEPERAIRTDYSGRGMYGATCLGLVHGSQGELIRFTHALLKEDPNTVDWIDGAAGDSMGRREITYWPRVQVTDVPES